MLYVYHTGDREPLAYCEECKCELYAGQTVYRVGQSDKFYCVDCIGWEELEPDDY